MPGRDRARKAGRSKTRRFAAEVERLQRRRRTGVSLVFASVTVAFGDFYGRCRGINLVETSFG